MASNTTSPAPLVKGQRVGKWTVLEDQRHTFVDRVWARCDCGTRRHVQAVNLRTSRSKSCGCANKANLAKLGHRNRKHIINPGDVFTRLTVLDSSHYGRVKCVCACGTEVTCRAASLYGGGTKSCGCITVENARAMGLSRRSQNGASLHPLFSTYMRVRSGDKPLYGPWRKSGDVFIRDVEAEIGPRPEGKWFKCKDDELGYIPGNIYWGERFNVKNQKVVLTLKQKQEIADAVRAGTLHRVLADRYKVSKSLISTVSRDPRFGPK